jgi:hypothetical protein
VLPALIAHLPASDWDWREVRMAGRLELTLAEYRALEACDLWLSYDRTSGSVTCAGGRASGHCVEPRSGLADNGVLSASKK